MARLPVFDLNALTVAAPKPGYDWSKRLRGVQSGPVTVHLGDIATPLVQFLRDSESVVGCVAWITSTRLMDELVGKPVSLIVNKEWALRDGDKKPASVRNRANLARLTGGLRRQDFPAPLSSMSGASDEIDAVRCVGHSPRARTANNPLLHHKFVVRLSAGKPVAVWTGSSNFTVNASSSLENAVSIEDPTIAAAYLAEWARVAAISEPLNFKAGAAAPSWGPRRAVPAAASDGAEAKKRPPAKPKPNQRTPAPGAPTVASERVAAKPRPKRTRKPTRRPAKNR